jgi:hypothetical protein
MVIMIDLYEKLDYEDLTPDIRLLADVCGIDSARLILKNLAGLQFYIPKITSFEGFVYKYLVENKHKNNKEIARDLEVSEAYIKTVKKRRSKV